MQNMKNNPHVSQYRVYYEDTDAGGIVYYANYLKFAERARTDWLRDQGILQSELSREKNLWFVVSRVEADFVAPARLDDTLVIETCLQESGKVRMQIQQTIKNGEKTLVRLQVTIACVQNSKPARLPEKIGSRKPEK